MVCITARQPGVYRAPVLRRQWALDHHLDRPQLAPPTAEELDAMAEEAAAQLGHEDIFGEEVHRAPRQRGMSRFWDRSPFPRGRRPRVNRFGSTNGHPGAAIATGACP
jgi:hypothetical protein